MLNFALNLEYLEAQFYSFAAYGHGLSASLTDGAGTRGGVTGGHQVPFKSERIRQYAQEIAGDEIAHVSFLRAALGWGQGGPAGDRPQDQLHRRGAGRRADQLDARPSTRSRTRTTSCSVPSSSKTSASPPTRVPHRLISNKTYLEAAAGILSVEAYHAGIIRSELFTRRLAPQANAISGARDSLDGSTDLDQSITRNGRANLVPADANGITYSRNPGQVLNVVYLNKAQVSRGGFFPNSVNGTIKVSQNNA